MLWGDLRWPWPAGYARFELTTRYAPPIRRGRRLQPAMSEALGCGVRVYRSLPGGIPVTSRFGG